MTDKNKGEYSSNIEDSINFWNGESYEKYKTWLENRIKLNDNSSIFLYEHIENFLKIYNSKLGINAYLFKEKLFMLCLELKRLERAKKLTTEIATEFGRKAKTYLLVSSFHEADPKASPEKALQRYKSLMLANQNDRNVIKRYILSTKFITTFDNMQNYVNSWNNYLKNYMDDQDAWNELGDCYLVCNNYSKAFYCYEEMLLHNPYNYRILNKLGDIQASTDSSEGFKTAIKFYCRSLNLVCNSRAVWGICFCLDGIIEKDKKLDRQYSQIGKILKNMQENLYANSEFKFKLNDFFNFPKLIKS